jgi:hypothetical protein
MTEETEPTTSEEATGNGFFQWDAEKKKILAPTGAYLSGPQIVEILNTTAGYGYLLLDIHTAITAVLFGLGEGGGGDEVSG